MKPAPQIGHAPSAYLADTTIRETLKRAITYEVPVSIVVTPSSSRQTIRRTFRTVTDSDQLLDGLVPLVRMMIDESRPVLPAGLRGRAELAMAQCGAHDAGLPMGCACWDGDPRAVIAELVAVLDPVAVPEWSAPAAADPDPDVEWRAAAPKNGRRVRFLRRTDGGTAWPEHFKTGVFEVLNRDHGLFVLEGTRQVVQANTDCIEWEYV